MDSATKQMLEAVDKRLAKLQQIRLLIVEEFGETTSNGNGAIVKRAGRRSKAALLPNGTGRKTQLHDWLKKNGPATRGDIVKNSGLPEGTISGYLSTEKNLFENRDGKYHAR
jgi:hypothetical protein